MKPISSKTKSLSSSLTKKKTTSPTTPSSAVLTTTMSSSTSKPFSKENKTKKVATAPKLKSLFRSTSFSKNNKKSSSVKHHQSQTNSENDESWTINQAATFETHVSHDENHPPQSLFSARNNKNGSVQSLHGHDRVFGGLACPSNSSSIRRGILGSTSSGNSVHFGRTEILEFPRRAGDNPSVKFGAPLALDTTLIGRRTLSVDEYEDEHPIDTRRHKQELVLEAAQRMKLIRESGVSTPKDIRKAMQNAAEARDSREKQAKLFQKEWGDRHILTYRIST